MKERETCDFKDGVRQIDYVLAWDDTDDDPKKQEKREMFQANLLEEGIEVEQEPKEVRFTAFYFIYCLSFDTARLDCD